MSAVNTAVVSECKVSRLITIPAALRLDWSFEAKQRLSPRSLKSPFRRRQTASVNEWRIREREGDSESYSDWIKTSGRFTSRVRSRCVYSVWSVMCWYCGHKQMCFRSRLNISERFCCYGCAGEVYCVRAHCDDKDVFAGWTRLCWWTRRLKLYHTFSKLRWVHIHYCQKYWHPPPSNERFDYFSNLHEYKS